MLRFGRGSAELIRDSLINAVFCKSFLKSLSSNYDKANAVAAVMIDDEMLVPELKVHV